MNGKGWNFDASLTLGNLSLAPSAPRALRRRALGSGSPGVIGDQSRHSFWFFDIRQMTRALDDLKARGGNERRRFLNQGDWRGAVLVADQA